eukprot:3733731-Prymnesium_polylepis.1
MARYVRFLCIASVDAQEGGSDRNGERHGSTGCGARVPEHTLPHGAKLGKDAKDQQHHIGRCGCNGQRSHYSRWVRFDPNIDDESRCCCEGEGEKAGE